MLFLSFRNVLSQALRELHKNDNVTQAPSNCNKSGNLWETGIRFFEYIRRQILPDGLTGRVAFDSLGDRINAEYRVINVQRGGNTVEVGQYRYSKVGGGYKTILRTYKSKEIFLRILF